MQHFMLVRVVNRGSSCSPNQFKYIYIYILNLSSYKEHSLSYFIPVSGL